MTPARLLIVDDEPIQRESLGGFLMKQGYDVMLAADGESALAMIAASPFDVVISDLRMPGIDGLELLARARAIDPRLDVLIVTAYGNVSGAVEAMRRGAAGYLTKPIDLDELEIQVRRNLDRRALESEVRTLRRQVQTSSPFDAVVTQSGAMQAVLDLAARTATTDATVLLRGESGTGKEVLARAMHAASGRAGGPFVAVNCAAFAATLLESELFGHEKGAFTGAEQRRLGRFEAAAGGTLFLDEIGDLPQPLQIKLLRVLQERTFERVGGAEAIAADVRVIAATHRDLEAMIAEGSFRQDLFYRLNVVAIRLPALRERSGDVMPLVEHFRCKYVALYGRPVEGFSREVLDLLVRHDFPGNVRELENIVARLVVLARGPVATAEDLPDGLAAREDDGVAGGRLDDFHGDLPRFVDELEQRLVREALDRHAGNQSQAARNLGLTERNLRYKMKKWRW